MRREDRREPGIVIFRQPQREDIELSVAGEHCLERGKVPERLLHHLCTGLYEDAVHCRGNVQEFRPTPGSDEQAERELSLRFLVERADDISEVIDLIIGRPRASALSRDAKSRPLITRAKTPTLKNSINFS